MSSIIDFSSLVQDVCFKFSENKVYKVPPITGTKAHELFLMGKELEQKTKENGNQADQENLDFLSYQAKFIAKAVVKVEGTSISELTEEEVKEFPILIQKKVVELINKQIIGVEEDSKEEKK